VFIIVSTKQCGSTMDEDFNEGEGFDPHFWVDAQSNVSLLWQNNVFFLGILYSNAYGD